MKAVDTSSLIAFFAGDGGRDVDAVRTALDESTLIMLPPVLADLLSDPKLPRRHEHVLLELPRAQLKASFWERVGFLRRSLLADKRKARLADAMIAQCCLDHGLALITRDADFRAIAKISGLILL